MPCYKTSSFNLAEYLHFKKVEAKSSITNEGGTFSLVVYPAMFWNFINTYKGREMQNVPQFYILIDSSQFYKLKSRAAADHLLSEVRNAGCHYRGQNIFHK